MTPLENVNVPVLFAPVEVWLTPTLMVSTSASTWPRLKSQVPVDALELVLCAELSPMLHDSTGLISSVLRNRTPGFERPLVKASVPVAFCRPMVIELMNKELVWPRYR